MSLEERFKQLRKVLREIKHLPEVTVFNHGSSSKCFHGYAKTKPLEIGLVTYRDGVISTGYIFGIWNRYDNMTLVYGHDFCPDYESNDVNAVPLWKITSYQSIKKLN